MSTYHSLKAWQHARRLAVEEGADRVRRKFGEGAVRPAALEEDG